MVAPFAPASAFDVPRSGWLLAALPGVLLGSALQLQQPSLWAAWVYGGLLLVAVSVLVGLVGWQLRRRAAALGRWQPCMAGLMLAVAAFGLCGWRASIFVAAALPAALEGRDVLVTGLVSAMPQRNERGVRLRLAVESAQLIPSAQSVGAPVRLPALIDLGWYDGRWAEEAEAAAGEPTHMSRMLHAPHMSHAPRTPRAGERWRLPVRLKAPNGLRNPHGFDYELWLWEQGVQATGYVRTSADSPAPVRLAQTWSYPVEQARQRVRDAVFVHLAGPGQMDAAARASSARAAGLVAALVVGDQRAIERSDWDIFRTTGVAHLVSISGLHITMFAWLAALFIGWLWRRSGWLCLRVAAADAALVGGVLLASGYAVFSGWGVPSQRTVLMLASVALLRLGGRRWPWPWVWLLACAVVVLLDPWALLQAGFWLSFVAVGVLFATALDVAQRPQLPHQSDDPIGVAGFAGARSLSGYRHRSEMAPQRGQFLPTLQTHSPAMGQEGGKKWTAAAPLQPMPPIVRQAPRVRLLLLHTGGKLHAMLRQQWVVTLALAPLTLLLFGQVSVVGLLANLLAIPWVTLVLLPLSMLGVLLPQLWDAAAWAAQVLLWLLHALAQWPWATVSLATAVWWLAAAALLGGLLLVLRLPGWLRLLGLPLVLPMLLWQAPRPGVGEFDLLVADIGQGSAVLVRTARHSLLYDAGPRYAPESDAGQRVLVPLLRALGERIDLLLLSHRDLDHTGGAAAVLAQQPQAALSSSLEPGHALLQLRPGSQRCLAGQYWEWDGVAFELLQPLAEDYAAHTKSNALSCVLRISTKRQSALLTGDIEAAQEARLVASGAPLRSDLLLVPHHGSKTSSSPAFLDAVQPRFALVQAGYRNRFGHPAAAVMARYQERQIEVLESVYCGAASWQSAQPQQVRCERVAARRYWQRP